MPKAHRKDRHWQRMRPASTRWGEDAWDPAMCYMDVRGRCLARLDCIDEEGRFCRMWRLTSARGKLLGVFEKDTGGIPPFSWANRHE